MSSRGSDVNSRVVVARTKSHGSYSSNNMSNRKAVLEISVFPTDVLSEGLMKQDPRSFS